jgi:hypothetical protein
LTKGKYAAGLARRKSLYILARLQEDPKNRRYWEKAMKRELTTILGIACVITSTGCREAKAPAKEVKALEPLSGETAGAPAPPPPDAENATGVIVEESATEPVFIAASLGEPARVIAPADIGAPVTADPLTVLTQAVKSFSNLKKRAPKDLEELVKAGLISSLPKPPRGQEYIIDAERLEAKLK